MALFRNIIVPVPPEAQVVKTTGRVYIIREKNYIKEEQYNIDKRVTIGKLNDVSGETMNPNTNYATRYPQQFNEASNGMTAPVIKKIGLYVVALACAVEIGLYQALVNACGPVHANFIMDYAIYSIQYKSNIAKDFELLMKDQLLFSEKLYSDTWASEFFSKKFQNKSIDLFKEQWCTACKTHGITKVWLCIDGSNNDSVSDGNEYKEGGKAKSHKPNAKIYAYMYAISAKDGRQITYNIYRGGRVDSKAFIEMITYLNKYDIEIEGVILDRGFCDIDVFEIIISSNYKYVIMMQEGFHGFNNQLQKHGKEIKDNPDYLVGPGMFATTNKDRIFGKYPLESYVTLVYDSENGGARIRYFTGKIYNEIKRCNEAAACGLSVTVSKKCKKYISISEDGKEYCINKNFRDEFDRKGFSAIATSHDFGAEETLALYDLRDASEKQYMILKTQLGYYTGRSHQTEDVCARHFVGFIAGIIRNELRKRCVSIGYDFKTALRELNFLCIQRLPDNTYSYIPIANERQIQLLQSFGLWQSDLKFFADQETIRVNEKVYNQVAKMPETHGDKKEPKPKRRGPGRPKGSGKKKEDTKKPEKTGKKPGRPKGSKTTPGKKVISSDNRARKKPGRPKGHKNKKGAVNAKQRRAQERLQKEQERQEKNEAVN